MQGDNIITDTQDINADEALHASSVGGAWKSFKPPFSVVYVTCMCWFHALEVVRQLFPHPSAPNLHAWASCMDIVYIPMRPSQHM